MRKSHSGGVDNLQSLGGGDRLRGWCQTLDVVPASRDGLGDELDCLAVPPVPLVAVDGHLELLRIRELLHLTLIRVEILDIPVRNGGMGEWENRGMKEWGNG